MSKIRRSLTVAAVVSLLVSGLAVEASADDAVGSSSRPPLTPSAEPVARGLIVQTTTNEPSAALLAAADDALGTVADVAADHSITGRISTVDFDTTVTAEVAADAAQEIERRSDVVWAVPNVRFRVTADAPVAKNDTHFVKQRNVWDRTISRPTGGYSVKAPSLWRATEGSPDVRVAVLDTGILPGHPDLAGQTVAGHDFVGPDDPESSRKTYKSAGDGGGWDADPTDPGDGSAKGYCGKGAPSSNSSWHGTFVAGQVAARTNNRAYVAGVAPGVKVMPVRVLGKCGGWLDDILAGITYASGGAVPGVATLSAGQRARVINMSLGQGFSSAAGAKRACKAIDPIVQGARSRGAVVIAAAGNEGIPVEWAAPASCKNVVSVAATSAKGYSSSYSNFGRGVDMAAPGGDSLIEGNGDTIVGIGDTGTRGHKSYATLRYEGTSMAAPQVAAGAALLYSLGVPSASKVEQALNSSLGPFPKYSKKYARKKIRYRGKNYYLQLNCKKVYCGRGIFDLSRVQVPLTAPSIAGTPIIGEPLTASMGSWVARPKVAKDRASSVPDAYYSWFVDDVPTSYSGPTIYPRRADVGKRFSVRVSPAQHGFETFGKTSAPTGALADGPEVALEVLDRAVHGNPLDVRATVTGPAVEAGGVVQIRRGTTTVVATGTVDADGIAQITVPGGKVLGPKERYRASYLGTGESVLAASTTTSFSVRRRVTTMSLSISSSLKTSTRGRLKVTVKPRGGNDSIVSGPLTVRSGGRVVATATLRASDHWHRTITLPKFAKGKRTLTVKFGGSNLVHESTASKKITVKK